MLQSYYSSNPHHLQSTLGHWESFVPNSHSAINPSTATSCLQTHQYTRLPYESIFDRRSTIIPTNELDRNLEPSIDVASYSFNHVEQPYLVARSVQNLSSIVVEGPPPTGGQNGDPAAAAGGFSSSFVDGGGLASFWNGRYPTNIIARRNERERNRVKTINQTFAKLRHHLPSSSSGTGRRRKLSKVQILRLAIQYIHQLQKTLESEADRMDAKKKKMDRQTEPIEKGNLKNGHEGLDENSCASSSSSVVSSPPPPSQSDSYEDNGSFDLSLFMNNDTHGMAKPNKHMHDDASRKDDAQRDIHVWERLSENAFTPHHHPEDDVEARPSKTHLNF